MDELTNGWIERMNGWITHYKFQTIFYTDEPQLRNQFCEVFDLVNALWGQLSSEDDNDSKENGRSSDKPYYWNLTERRRRLAKWLTNVTRDKTDAKKVSSKLHSTISYQYMLSWGEPLNL